MAIKAVVFDIGGVLEYTPDLGLETKWEGILGLQAGELNQKLHEAWEDGSLGRCSEADVHRRIRDITGMDEAQFDAFMADLWREYLGTLNVELVDYLRGLRPQYQTAIISNSFVGAREKEEEAYHFSELVDFIIYSHEVGLAKPDGRIFELACERLGLEPPEMVFVDDVEVIVAAAREMGIHAIQFIDNTQTIAAIEACLGRSSQA